jgi:hypothetical protein
MRMDQKNYKNMKCRRFSGSFDKNKFELVLYFTNHGLYDNRTIFLEDFLGETPDEIADGLQKMAELLRPGNMDKLLKPRTCYMEED